MDPTSTTVQIKKPINGIYIKILVLIFAFAAPFFYTYQRAEKPWRPGNLQTGASLPSKFAEDAKNEAIRSGAVGLAVAITIMLMYRLDKLLNAKASKKEIKDIKVKVILAFLAFLLWISWTAVSHIMLTAHDEINDVPAQLGGLDSI